MGLTATLDNYGKPAWITVMVLSFVLFWPLGLAVLAYLIGSGRMSCWKHRGARRWRERMQSGMDGWYRAQNSSGNRAFDDYREETLRRLEEEQKEFRDFLDRLRHAKDKAEFDQFMAERRPRGPGPQPEPQA
ncbi:MAG: DUF2852 domain-containing protein [Alphaproteobacteria bacterium]|nr:DUF2852 domain-containing protein [Alphaproteobacteria bacterium]